MTTSCPASLSHRAQIPVWTPYPVGSHGAALCHKIFIREESSQSAYACPYNVAGPPAVRAEVWAKFTTVFG